MLSPFAYLIELCFDKQCWIDLLLMIPLFLDNVFICLFETYSQDEWKPMTQYHCNRDSFKTLLNVIRQFT